MNYSNLRSQILAAIKYPPKISAQALQEQLINIVNGLDLGALLLGVATPSSAPNTEANGFYFAFQSGTYANFPTINGQTITVDSSEVAIIVRSGNYWSKIHITTYPTIDPTTKHWMIGNEDTGVVAEGVNPHIDPETGNWFVGDFNTHVHAQGPAGQDAYQPFKGTFASQQDLENAFQNPEAGDTAYVEATVDGNDVLEVWDVVSGAWHNTHRTADSPVFGSGQLLPSVNIDDTHLEDPVAGSLAKAEDVKELKEILVGYEAEVLDVDVEESMMHDGYVYITNNGSRIEPGASVSKYFEMDIPDGDWDKIAFKTWMRTSQSSAGAAFGHYENGVFITDYTVLFHKQLKAETNYWWIVDLHSLLQEHPLISVFRSTVIFSATVPGDSYTGFECRYIKGYTVHDDVEYIFNQLDELTPQVDQNTEDISGIKEDVSDIKDALTYKEETIETPYEDPTTQSYATGAIGSEISINYLKSHQIWKFRVEEGKSYRFDSYMGGTLSIYNVYLVDKNGIVLDRFAHKSSSAPAVTWTDEPIDLVEGTYEIWMNVQTAKSSMYRLKSSNSEIIDISSLKEQVGKNADDIKNLKDSSGMSTKLMKVVIDENQNIMVRSALSNVLDAAVTLYRPLKQGKFNNITFNSLCVGDNGMADATLLANVVNSFTDSVSPFEGNFGPLYAQHGWAIPKFEVTSGVITSEDVNSKWIDHDHDDRAYYIGKVETENGTTFAYLIPEITGNGGAQEPSLNWWADDQKSLRPRTLTKDGDSSRVIVGSGSRFDLAVQVIKSTKYIVDDCEVAPGTYYCNKFTVAQEIECKAPWGVAQPSDWFLDDVPFTQDAFIMCRSFNFTGLSCTVNLSVKCETPMQLSLYRYVQPQMPDQYAMNDTTFYSKTYFPKVSLKLTGSEVGFDYGIDSNSDNDDQQIIHRSSGELYDVDDLPDRIVTVLKDVSANGLGLIGMASGLSLDKGMSVNSVRLDQNTENSTIMTWNSGESTHNKVYFRQFRAVGNGEGWSDRILDTAFVKDFMTYFAWFDPNDNPGQQVYYVKEGDYWIVYAHSQTRGRMAINLPAMFEGMQVVETIEHTAGATLLTDVVTSGRLYVGYGNNNNGQANFITFKLK